MCTSSARCCRMTVPSGWSRWISPATPPAASRTPRCSTARITPCGRCTPPSWTAVSYTHLLPLRGHDGLDIVGLAQGFHPHIVVHAEQGVLQVSTGEAVLRDLADAAILHVAAEPVSYTHLNCGHCALGCRCRVLRLVRCVVSVSDRHPSVSTAWRGERSSEATESAAVLRQIIPSRI